MLRPAHILCFALTLALCSPFAAGAETKKSKTSTAPATTAPATTPSKHATRHAIGGELLPQRAFTAGGNLGLVGGAFAIGVTGNVLFKFNNELPLWVGGETGLLYAGKSEGVQGANVSGHLISIPFLATAIYQLNIAGMGEFTPYIGGSLGLSVTPVSAEADLGPIGKLSASSTELYFEIYAKPGVRWRDFMAELRLGFLKDNFMFLPTVSYIVQF